MLEKIFWYNKMESSLFTVTSLRATKEREKWSDEEEEFLKKMERQCDVYYNHHTGDFKYYHRLASKFNIPILMGFENWWVVNLATHDIVDGMRKGAGEILERYCMPRGRFQLPSFLEAREIGRAHV